MEEDKRRINELEATVADIQRRNDELQVKYMQSDNGARTDFGMTGPSHCHDLHL